MVIIKIEDLSLMDEKRHFCLAADSLGRAIAGELTRRIFLKTAMQLFQPANNSAIH
jgi:hypothetical protein